MSYNELRPPFFRLLTAVIFAVATVLISNVKAEDTCSWHDQWCRSNGGYMMISRIEEWPGNPDCHTIYFMCTYGPYYSACDTCTW
jgi:hypothetical protein